MIGVYFANGLGNAVMMTPFLRALRVVRPGVPVHVVVVSNPEDPGRWQVARELWSHYKASGLVDGVADIPRTADHEHILRAIDNTFSELICFPHGEPNAVKDAFLARGCITAPRPTWEIKHEVLHYMDAAYDLGYRGPVPALESFVEPRKGPGTGIVLCDESNPHPRFTRKRWGQMDALAPVLEAWTGERVERLVPRSIEDTAQRLRRARMLVTTDTFTMHLGAAIGVPMVTLWGPTRLSKNGPWTDTPYEVVRVGLDCQPCQNAAGWTTCDDAQCMKQMGVGDVMAAVRRLDARLADRVAA